MLTGLDDTPWHQIASTFDHVGTSDVRFFDRLWFAASDRVGRSALQFTIGVYQNMNVVDGGFVVIVDGHQHNLRVSRQLRPTYDVSSGPLRIDVIEPMKRLALTIAPNPSGIHGELEWIATLPAQEEHTHHRRRHGRVLEDYQRYDQIGECRGVLEVAGRDVAVDSWFGCRDHSWGVREHVGIPEPVTGSVPDAVGGLFSFLFFSTDTHGGHVQVAQPAGGERYLSATVVDRVTGAIVAEGARADVEAEFVDDDRPRRMRRVVFTVRTTTGDELRFELEAEGPAVAMQGLGYGGYDDGLGLGVWRGLEHLETEVWDVSHPAVVTHVDRSSVRPVHRIQPVSVNLSGALGASHGTGSLTFIAEGPLEDLRDHE